jgi:hypothetical protein
MNEQPEWMKPRKADVAARLAELEYEIALAIRQGGMEDKFNWLATFSGPTEAKPEEHWIAVLTVGKT